MKLTPKQHLAHKMRTPEEVKRRVPIFQTKAWELRKEMIAKRVANREQRSKKNKQ